MQDRLYHYAAEVISIYDGDTITLDIDLGCDMWLRGEAVRLKDIDAPEVRGKDKQHGIVSRNALRHMLPVGSSVIVKTDKDKRGKFGRFIATVYLDGLNVNKWLVDNRHAVERFY